VRVVFDTNIYISALIFPGSIAESAMFRIIDGRDTLLVSKDILNELLMTLARKFSKDREQLSRVAFNISEIALMINTGEKISVFADEADNRILECAVSGKADIIVTGDKAILDLKSYKDIKIISLKQYLL
jgi:putative PIN family toxin of toxin-antitoxin system